jgi:restriction system protein
MPRYWVIAPVESKKPQLFDNVWQFDVANNLISIGWSELGDISKMSREALSDAVAVAYPDRAKGLIFNMLWAFYHEIGPGDFVIVRRGQKILAAVGKVVRVAFYAPGRNPFLASPDYSHHNFLEVEWQAQPRDKVFPSLVFPMYTLTEISEVQYHNLLEDPAISTVISEPPIEAIDQNAFVLEKYLEDFIVSNFEMIFKGKLHIYEDAEGGDGQQYATDIGPIDILAVEPGSNSLSLSSRRAALPIKWLVKFFVTWDGSRGTFAKTAKA